MSGFFLDAWDRINSTPGDIWSWFGRLNREEWLVTLAVVCIFGFFVLLGFKTRRI